MGNHTAVGVAGKDSYVGQELGVDGDLGVLASSAGGAVGDQLVIGERCQCAADCLEVVEATVIGDDSLGDLAQPHSVVSDA
ncbi:hypothetical protein [Mycolicibacterium sp. 120270]|uniref:hypothetical protein n=1 Tax=Mycolicibacterium sp. 120270 TaxID=3090600 RepID=UPI00299D205B|nr:hypothetical protein [Mycolicibacterium sp. 120270]MDX1886892.1 hypothetical protein [Mycolicibacterium sp. 120270]